MASLTESILIYKNNSNNNCEDIYLCLQKSQMHSHIIDGFKCYKFSNIEELNKYYLTNKSSYFYHRSSIITINKMIPINFHPIILNYKLQSIFWVNNVSIYQIKKNN